MIKRLSSLLFAVAVAAPLLAQSTALTVFATSAQTSGGDEFGGSGSGITSEFDNGSGFGLSLDRAFGSHLSGELAVFSISSAASLRDNSDSLSLGDVDMIPITAMLRLHTHRDGPFDLYAGAGAAYVITGDLDSADMRAAGIDPVQLDNETTFVVGGGLTWSFAQRWGATLDVRYLPLTLHGDVDGDSEGAGIDPLLVSAGLRVRF